MEWEIKSDWGHRVCRQDEDSSYDQILSSQQLKWFLFPIPKYRPAQTNGGAMGCMALQTRLRIPGGPQASFQVTQWSQWSQANPATNYSAQVLLDSGHISPLQEGTG